jgi:hypothetical protein
LLVVLPIGAWEVYWRAQGFHPEVKGVDEAWILNMYQVPTASTVVLGTSRIRSALDPDAFRRTFGGDKPLNLALPGSSPIPVMEYLADSTRFDGLLIVELMPLYAFEASQTSAQQVTDLLAQYRRDRVSPARLSENWLRVHLLRHVLFREPQLLPERFVLSAIAGKKPEPVIGRTRPDGFAPRDQRSLLRTKRWAPGEGFLDHDFGWFNAVKAPDDSAFLAIAGRINRSADRIMARGGKVVLLYMPGCGERLRIENRIYPRARYWDRLAQATHAVAIATEDYPALSGFECYDGSHLDATDAPKFAAALGSELRGRLGSAHL